MKSSIAASALAAALLISPPASAEQCAVTAGQWLEPGSGKIVEAESLLAELAAKPRVLLLGEAHTTAAHHRWQSYTLAALHAHRSDVVVGFEMLPRAVQPVLDQWSAGGLTEAELLAQSEWRQHWGYDAAYYLPLFHLARLHRLPVLALNIDRELIGRVGREGWQAIPEDQRGGVSDPAPASADYRESLAMVYAYKQQMGDDPHSAQPPDDDAIQAVKGSEAFERFVEAQLTWDRAMAEVLAEARRRHPQALIVGIVGRGHAEFGHGIPHQLADLGIDRVDVLLPWSSQSRCDELPAGIARAVFGVDEQGEDPPAPRPLLGVLIETADDGVLVTEIVADSVAERSGLLAGDIIRGAAGFPTANSGELVEIIRRQAPGTWLPIDLLRDGESRQITARFPRSFE